MTKQEEDKGEKKEDDEDQSGVLTVSVRENAPAGTVVANLLLARAALLTSPLVVVVGLSLSIPLAMASDVARQRERLTPALLAGALAVWLAFLGVSVARVPKDGGLLGRMCAHCPTRCRHCAGLW